MLLNKRISDIWYKLTQKKKKKNNNNNPPPQTKPLNTTSNKQAKNISKYRIQHFSGRKKVLGFVDFINS